MERRKRRSFTPEFRAEAVRLAREGSKSLPQVANDIDLTESALRNWVREADGGEGKESAGALSTAEREELVRLRKEVCTTWTGAASTPAPITSRRWPLAGFNAACRARAAAWTTPWWRASSAA